MIGIATAEKHDVALDVRGQLFWMGKDFFDGLVAKLRQGCQQRIDRGNLLRVDGLTMPAHDARDDKAVKVFVFKGKRDKRKRHM